MLPTSHIPALFLVGFCGEKDAQSSVLLLQLFVGQHAFCQSFLENSWKRLRYHQGNAAFGTGMFQNSMENSRKLENI